MKLPFLGSRLVVFTAHPDDEGLAAGTMYENHRAGGKTFLICATSGEKGKSHLARPVSDAALARIRRGELRAAAKALKIDRVIFFGFPDAGVRANAARLYAKAVPVITRLKPDRIVSFGPDGVSAHWDHITVGRVARRIAKKLKTPLAAFTLTPEVIRVRRNQKTMFLKRRKFGKYAGIPELREGDIKIKINAAVKRRAMRHHVSQFGTRPPFAELPKTLRDKMMGYEYFVEEKI